MSRAHARNVRAGHAWWAVLLVAVMASGCRPLFVPAVPADLPPFPNELRLSEIRLAADGDRVEVAFVADAVPAPTWVSVQWFPPAGRAVASASVRLTEASVGRDLRMGFPDDVARARAGVWRAVLSADGRILRQLEWTEPAGP